MKQKKCKMLSIRFLCVCLLMSMLGLSACGQKQEELPEETLEKQDIEVETEEVTKLSAEELIDIAFFDAGFDWAAGSDIKVSASKDNVRTVTFTIQGAAYSYDIDEITGMIVNSTKPDVVPDADVDPVDIAMSKMGNVDGFRGASNIKAHKTTVDGKEVVVITFDNGGSSYEYEYDILSGELTQK